MRFKQPKLKQLLLLSALGAALCQNTFGGLKTGDTFPDLTSFKLEGKLPDTLKGKVVIVDFWASWCGPCKDSFPVMNQLIKKYADRGLVIVAVNADEVRADMDTFLTKNPATFTVVRDAAQKLVEKADVGTMPTSFILDRDGKVRYLHNGFHGEKTKKEYETEIESLLAR
jgi:thiol-disulfide isomerase/thioredoxin